MTMANHSCQQPPVNGPQPRYPQYERPRGNGFGVAGFVLAVIGLVLCWVPVINWVLWALGLIFSIVGMFKAPRGLAICGLIVSLIGIIIMVILLGILAGVAATAAAL